MFDIIYMQVFPVIGEFFGKIISITNMPFSSFINAIQFTHWLSFTNIMTGQIGSFKLYSGFGRNIIALVLRTITFGVNTSLPVWAVFLLSFASIYAIVAIIKFIT